jgi:hypothetical protein
MMDDFIARITLMLLLAPLALIIMMPVIAYTRIESRIVSTNIYKRTLEHKKHSSMFVYIILVLVYIAFCALMIGKYPFYVNCFRSLVM